MARFLLGVVVGILAVVLGGLLIVAGVSRLVANKPTVVPADSALVLSLQGAVPESAPMDVPLPFLENQGNPTVRDLWTSLHAAATDNRIKALVLQPESLAIGWGKLEEIGQQIADFKRSGKPVYAFLQGPGAKEYYLGSMADRIFVTPDDSLSVKGFRIEESYFKNTLDKFGIGVQVDHVGRYKDAGDSYTRTAMTPETREVLNGILDQLSGDFYKTVANGRHKRADDIRSLVDMGPFTAEQAKAVGLVDDLAYEDQVYTELKKKLQVNSLNKLRIRNYTRATPGKGDRIALLAGEGDIMRDLNANNTVIGAIASGPFSKVIRQVRDDSSVKGVIVRVDSPGGDAVASDEILHELKLLSAVKPLVISMSDVAASGGYFISMTGDPVFSYPNTITGSIGVLYVRPNFKGLYDKLGVAHETITRGKLADIDSLSQPLSDAGIEKLHDEIQYTYHAFVGKVAAARRKNYDQIDPLAQGRVWMGSQARQNGLVDQLGGLNEAVASIRRRAKLSDTGDTNLVPYPPRRSLFQAIREAQIGDPTASDELLFRTLRTRIAGFPGPAELRGGLLEILPYRFDVR